MLRVLSVFTKQFEASAVTGELCRRNEVRLLTPSLGICVCQKIQGIFLKYCVLCFCTNMRLDSSKCSRGYHRGDYEGDLITEVIIKRIWSRR
jgi:hypothetical protein